MKNIISVFLLLMFLTGGFGFYSYIETDTRYLISLIASCLFLLDVIGSFLLRKRIPGSTGLVRLLFGGENSLFEKGSIKYTAKGTIIVCFLLILYTIAYIVWYVAFRT